MMDHIARNIADIRARILEAAGSDERGGEIKLVAATKTRTPAEIRAAVDAGADAVGENRVQEFCEKGDSGAYEGIDTHFIGHLQTNKVNRVVGRVTLIESVDSLRLAQAIDRAAAGLGIMQDVLAEINIAGEESKYGLAPEKLGEFLYAAADFRYLRVMGIMTIAPKTEENSKIRAYFAKMYQLFIDNRVNKYDNIQMRYLSMGMSEDYIPAILEGANMIRIGTGIFGPRE